jgi:hypothetical protein
LDRESFGGRSGEALAPERERLASLNRIRATIGEMNFASQHQQSPTSAGGA